MKHRALRALLPAVAAAAVLGSAPTAGADTTNNSLEGWLRTHAAPITSTALDAPLTDLTPLRRSVGNAVVVGLGESTHGAHEELALKARTVRMLVESKGFRSVAWEEDWTLGRRIDAWLRTGAGNLPALMSEMSPQWQNREVDGLLRWLRGYNAGHTRKVGFVGVEFFLTPPQAYTDVQNYVAKAAPHRLAELHRQLDPIRPDRQNMYEYLGWYANQPNKASYTRHARHVYELVKWVGRHDPLIVRTAWQIKAFYEHYQLSFDAQPTYRDAHSWRNLRWWRNLTGDKVAFWAASPHTAVAPQLRIAVPPDPDLHFASAGSYLRRWYGHRYLSIGYTLDHGSLGAGATMPPPDPDWFERPLARVPYAQFSIDLRRPAPPAVCRWLHADLRTRGLPDRGPDSVVTGGTLAQSFDVLVHRQVVGPAQPL